MHRGFAKNYRKIVDWCWYSDPVPRGIMMHLILVANIKEKKWRNIVVEPGQFVTSVKGLADKLGFSVQQIRTGLDKLKSTGEITIKTTNKFTVITLTNWLTYNDADYNSNKQITNEQQTNNKQITTTKEVKKEKKKPLSNGFDGECFFDMAWQAYPKKKGVKKKAKSKYVKTVKSEADHKRLMETLDWYVQDCSTTNTILKNGETFFNQWQDIEENMKESNEQPATSLFDNVTFKEN